MLIGDNVNKSIAQFNIGEIQQRTQLFGVKFNRNFRFFARAAAQLLLHEIENRAELVNVNVLIVLIAFVRVKLLLQYAHGQRIVAHAFVGCICGRTERCVVPLQQCAQFRDRRSRPVVLVVVTQLMFHDVDERA